MTKEEFIEAIKSAVVNGSIESVKKILIFPPGKPPDKNFVLLSEWYKSKSADDKEKILAVIERSVFSAVFNFLCILDGVASIEKSFDKGILELIYKKNEIEILLNDSNDDYYLHELL